jgi:type II secretory pathway component PulJ
MRHTGNNRRGGFTLLEMVAVCGLLSILMLMLIGAMLGALRTEKQSTATAARAGGLALLADDFRRDVAASSTTPARLDDTTAGPSCLILSRGEGKSIIYLWDEKKLERIEHTGKETFRREEPLHGKNQVEFVRPTSANLLVTLRIREVINDVAQVPIEIRAALGGDLQ